MDRFGYIRSVEAPVYERNKEAADSDAVVLEVKINMLFGFKVREVAETVQRAIIEDVENTTGMTVAKVTVVVQKIEEAAEDSSVADDTEI